VKAGMTILSSKDREREMHTWAFLQVKSPHYRISSDFCICTWFVILPVYTTDASFLSLEAHWRCCVQPTEVPLCRPRELSWLSWLINKTLNNQFF